ncbi:MAG: phosphomannomutase [Candidatus Dadabacteria bacterium]|nr:MAG: phosphomannomutase [Candidatus Dadabacteria bacterium]
MRIQDLMEQTGVKFGTSGARGLAQAITDRVAYAYTLGFLQHLETLGEFGPGTPVAVGGDHRPSTPRILRAVARAVADRGGRVVNGGLLPSPALALYGFTEGIPSVMVTGSHIPDDRNGIKYTRPGGEILKRDEAAIREQVVELPDELFDPAGNLVAPPELPPEDPTASRRYVERYLAAFPEGFLRGKRIGLYEHSAVARDLLAEILGGLGAEVVRLGRSDRFIPVDTEAIRPEDVELARRWAAEHRLDALVSADGDSDRPLVADERGKWLRGDVVGVLTARLLGADAVVCPVSCNTAVEQCGWFRKVVRTRIGSPYVIEGMLAAAAEGYRTVVGYEANGGFLTASPIGLGRAELAPLPTRDAAIVILGVLLLAVREGKTVSELREALPRRYTASDRLKEFPTEASLARVRQLAEGGPTAIEAAFGGRFGPVAATDTTDGLRITFASGEIVHLRPSGNAPEFRCYTEADSEERAEELLREALAVMETWRP